MWPKRQVTLQCGGSVLYHVFCAVLKLEEISPLFHFLQSHSLSVKASLHFSQTSKVEVFHIVTTSLQYRRLMHPFLSGWCILFFFHFWQRTRMKTTPTREWRWCGSSSVNTAANCASLAPNSRATCPSPTPVSKTLHVHSVTDTSS